MNAETWNKWTNGQDPREFHRYHREEEGITEVAAMARHYVNTILEGEFGPVLDDDEREEVAQQLGQYLAEHMAAFIAKDTWEAVAYGDMAADAAEDTIWALGLELGLDSGDLRFGVTRGAIEAYRAMAGGAQ